MEMQISARNNWSRQKPATDTQYSYSAQHLLIRPTDFIPKQPHQNFARTTLLIESDQRAN